MNSPSVSVVIPAHKRPVELRRAIDSVLSQDYGGQLDVIVVFDRAEPDLTLERQGERPVTVIPNVRAEGLAGGRNTGILRATGELVAFCDDDDYWNSRKLRAQVDVLVADPNAHLVTCAMVVEYGDHCTVRLAGTSQITHPMLVRSRMSMLHSSSLLFRRASLLGPLGLIDEELPGSQSEDWDILLRAAELRPIEHIDEPLVHVVWGASSYFSRRWDTRIDAHHYMLSAHPAIARDRRASARMMGKIAFAHACSAERWQAWRWSARTLRRDPRQWRGVLAAGVAVAPRSGELVLGLLNRYGRGV